MQIVIDIPGEAYKQTQNDVYVIYDKMYSAIKNGKPLPKGHGRLIDADEIHFESREFDTYEDYSRAFDAIDYAETIVEADKEGEDDRD